MMCNKLILNNESLYLTSRDTKLYIVMASVLFYKTSYCMPIPVADM